MSGFMFRFLVSCKEVGFMVYNLKSYSCKQFAMFFFLWGGDGLNWRRDLALWCEEQEAEWTLVGSKSKKSYADAVRSPLFCRAKHKPASTLKRASNKSIFTRLLYPNDYHRNFAKDFRIPIRHSDPAHVAIPGVH